MVRGDLLDMSVESFDRCMASTSAALSFLYRNVRGGCCLAPGETYRSIHVVTSVSAEIVSPDRAEYCISKAGASMMTKALAARLAPEGIGVFELRPGIIRTPMTGPVADRYDARIAEGLVPSGRWGEPSDIGKVVVPLATWRFRLRDRRRHPRGWRPVDPPSLREGHGRGLRFHHHRRRQRRQRPCRAADRGSGRPVCLLEAGGATGTRSSTCRRASRR
jgi:hypothetical protein